MIVAIERNKFTYLYKYNQIRVDINQVLDKTIDELQWILKSDFQDLVPSFNKIIPLFEQDHEVVLLEIDKSKVQIQDGIVLLFESILSIYPLTKIGSQLLEGKINENFKVNNPVFERVIEEIRLSRSMDIRQKTAVTLLRQYSLEKNINRQHIALIESSIKKNLLSKSYPQDLSSFLDHLIAYNKTPSYIPDGNIENICKIGAIAIKYLGKSDDVFTNGPFYRSCIKYKSKINSKSVNESFKRFLEIEDNELNTSFEKMVELISKDYNGLDIFKASYFFLAFKTYLNKNDNNIAGINDEIRMFIAEDQYSAAIVISLIGYTFSFENMYESIHILSNAPLLKSNKKGEDPIQISEGEPPEQNKRDNQSSQITPEPAVIHEAESDAVEQIDENKKIDEGGDCHNNNNGNNQTQIAQEVFEKSVTGPTVDRFRSYLTETQPKSKQKVWFDFLDHYFPGKYDNINLEHLLDKLDTMPDIKDKLLKAKKDKELLKAFFDSNKWK